MIKEARWFGWVWVGESSFWYRPTRVVPDQRPLNGRCCCCTARNIGKRYCFQWCSLYRDGMASRSSTKVLSPISILLLCHVEPQKWRLRCARCVLTVFNSFFLSFLLSVIFALNILKCGACAIVFFLFYHYLQLISLEAYSLCQLFPWFMQKSSCTNNCVLKNI